MPLANHINLIYNIYGRNIIIDKKKSETLDAAIKALIEELPSREKEKLKSILKNIPPDTSRWHYEKIPVGIPSSLALAPAKIYKIKKKSKG